MKKEFLKIGLVTAFFISILFFYCSQVNEPVKDVYVHHKTLFNPPRIFQQYQEIRFPKSIKEIRLPKVPSNYPYISAILKQEV